MEAVKSTKQAQPAVARADIEDVARVETTKSAKQEQRTRLFFRLFAGCFFGAIALLFVDGRLNPKTRALRRARRHLEVIFTPGRQIEDDFADGVFGAGAVQERVYCTTAPDREVLAFFSTELSKRGFTPVPFTMDEHFADSEHAIGQFENQSFSYRLYLMDHALGRVGPYCRPGETYLLTRLGN